MTDHTPISKISRLDVISTGARRRWTLEEKRRIVGESYSAPRLASVTARRNGLSASQLFTWRRLAREGRLAEAEEATPFAPAIISQEPLPSGPNACSEPPAASDRSLSAVAIAAAGRIEIVLACGHRIVVDNDIDAGALARVLTVLERR